MRVTFKRAGNWNRVGMIVNGMSRRTYQQFFDTEFRAMINDYLRRVKRHISAQDLDWIPLAESTVRKKGDSRAWDDSGYFKDHLTMTEKKVGFVFRRFFAGAIKGDIHEPSGLPMSVLANMLEYGYRHIPARPLFGPTLERLIMAWRPLFASMQIRVVNKMRVGI